jgi:tryptophan-rich hypothetical protein
VTREPPLAPRHPRHLAGSAWTWRGNPDELCHWRVIEVHGDEAVLQPILAPTRTLRLPWRELRERARWSPGWR